MKCLMRGHRLGNIESFDVREDETSMTNDPPSSFGRDSCQDQLPLPNPVTGSDARPTGGGDGILPKENR